MPQNHKRPSSPTQAALQVAKIATGEAAEKDGPSNRRTLKVLPVRKGKATDQQGRSVG